MIDKSTKFKAAMGFWEGSAQTDEPCHLLTVVQTERGGLEFTASVKDSPTSLTISFIFTGTEMSPAHKEPYQAGLEAGAAIAIFADEGKEDPRYLAILATPPEIDEDIQGWKDAPS